MSKTKKLFLSILFGVFVLTALFIVLTGITGNFVCYVLSITFGTVFYHFAMRWLVGNFTRHKFNYKSFWFKEKSFEKNLYKALRVKKWKGKMPSYNPETYITRNSPLEDIINTMCRNEVIHEIIALLSFVPILFSPVFDTVLVFVITSIIACLCDLIFVVMQRYNRPRVVKLMIRQNKTIGKGK